MDLVLKFFFLGLLAAVAAVFVHSISRMLLGRQANGYPSAIIILAFTVPPWWVGVHDFRI